MLCDNGLVCLHGPRQQYYSCTTDHNAVDNIQVHATRRSSTFKCFLVIAVSYVTLWAFVHEWTRYSRSVNMHSGIVSAAVGATALRQVWPQVVCA